jgi:ABC-type multidrug transport system fused ATPase/permease subunit
LDPFEEFEEGQLWAALEKAHLKPQVLLMPGHLDYECGEEGSNLR